MLPGKEILRPYDVATWTLPLAMGVTVEKSAGQPPSAVRLTEIKPATKAVIAKHASDPKPRIATYTRGAAISTKGGRGGC